MAKRISRSSVDWGFVAECFKNEDKQIVTALKIKSDKYLRELEGKPADLPKIDWNLYRSRISAPGMVDLFQKSYEAFKIPYPSDQGMLAKIEQGNMKLLQETDKRHVEILEEIKNLEKKLKVLESEMRYKDMTMEEFYLARPDLMINPDKPYHWPHMYIESRYDDIKKLEATYKPTQLESKTFW